MDERNFQFMFYGFAAVWLLLALYVATLVRRGRNVRTQIDNLKRMVEEKKS